MATHDNILGDLEKFIHFPENLRSLTASSPYIILTGYENVILNKGELLPRQIKDPIFNLCLPIPNEQISILDSQRWEDEKNIATDYWGMAKGIGADIVKSAGGVVTKKASLETGLAKNDLSALLYAGQNNRTIELSWNLIPESKEEADKLKNIVKILRLYSYPDGAISDTLIKYPLYWDIQIYYKTNKIFRLVDAVIENMTTNYSGGPEGTLATFNDGNPIVTSLTINFKQIFKATRDVIRNELN